MVNKYNFLRMQFTAENLLGRTFLGGLSDYEKGVCDVVAAVMSYSADCRYRLDCAEADADAFKKRLDGFSRYLPGWLYVHNNTFVDDVFGVYDPLVGKLGDAKRIFEAIKRRFSAMPPALLRSDICSLILECVSLCDGLMLVVEQYKADEAGISQNGKRCLELKRAYDDKMITQQDGYVSGYADGFLSDDVQSVEDCERKLNDVFLKLQNTVSYGLIKDVDDADEEVVASMLYHKTCNNDYCRYLALKNVMNVLKSTLLSLKERFQKKRIMGWIKNDWDLGELRKVHNQAQMYRGELSATQCAFVVFREFVERGYTVGGKEGWKTLSCKAFVGDMNHGVDKGGDNYINDNVFTAFRGFCKKSGSLYVFPEGEGGKHSPQLKKVLDGCPEVDHVVTTVRKVFASSKTAIA